MFQGWWIVATHFVVMLFATGFYTYGFPLLMPAVIEEFGSDAGTINGVFTMVGLLGIVVSPLAGPLVDTWSAKGLLLIGTSCLVAGLLGLSLATSDVEFVVIGGLFFGLSGILTGPMTGSAVISRWFTATRGRAFGLAAIGTSTGGILIPLGIGASLETIGWRAGLQVLAAITALVALPLVTFRFWNTPAERGQAPEPAGDEASAPSVSAEEPATSREILSGLPFWLFTVSLSLFLASYMGTVANLGNYYADLGLDAARAPLLMSLLAAGGIVGKLAFGYLADRIPLKVGLAAAIVTTGMGILLLTFEPSYSVLVVASILLGVATGGILPVWNAMVPVLFGVTNFGRTMGLMSPVIALVTAPAFVIAGSMRDTTGSYVAPFQGFLVVLVVALLLIPPLRAVPRGTPA